MSIFVDTSIVLTDKETGKPVTFANFHIRRTEPNNEANGATNTPDGFASFWIKADEPELPPAILTIHKDGYQDVVMPITITPSMGMIRVALDRPAVSLGPLAIKGQFFTQNGQPITVIDGSDFSLFQRYLDGEDITPILSQRQALGFNMCRVWLLNQSVVGYRNATQQPDGSWEGPIDYGIDPRHDPDFYIKLRSFCLLLGVYDLNAHLTVFTQTQTLMPNPADQQRHLDATYGAVRGLGHVIVSRVNEDDQHDNRVSDSLVRSLDVLTSRGSNGADGVPPRHDDPWDWEEYHSNDLNEWWRKGGHNAMEFAAQSNRPCLTTEKTRPDNDGMVAHFEDDAAGGALLCGGSCFHSQQGKFSRLYEGLELSCAEAHVRGAKSVPLEFQDGAYQHREDLEGDGILRAYSRRLNDGREHVVRIRD